MKKTIIFAFYAFIWLVNSGWASTVQYWYLTPTGSGSNYNGSGMWKEPPNTLSNSMSAAQFNNPKNWSKNEDSNKIDPDDLIYLKGAGWTSTAYDLVPVYGCTIDGWETGTFDPKASGTQQADPVFTWARIFVNVDNVTIRNMRFRSGRQTNVYYGIDRSNLHFINKVSGHTLTNNYFHYDATGTDPSQFLSAQLRITFITDSEISHNYAYAVSTGETNHYYRWFSMNGGSRNKIIHNTVINGGTSLYFNQSRLLQYSPVPPSGSYRYDPDYNMQYNEIAYNHLDRDHKGHEGLSLDNADSTENIGIWERDTVARINSGNPRIITLSHAGWAASGKDYSGTFLVNIGDSAAKYGRHSLIAAQSGATITLEEEIPNLAVGDTIVIGHAWRRNWIHNNYWPETDRGYGGLSLLLEGICLENIVENNTMVERTATYTQFASITLSVLTGQYVATDRRYPWNNGVTKLPSYGPNAFNIFRNNTVGRIVSQVYHQNSLGLSPLWQNSWNNAFYNNTLLDTSSSGGYRINRSNIYIPAGEANQIRSIDSYSTIMEYDPTDDSWLTDKVRDLHPPKGFSIQPK